LGSVSQFAKSLITHPAEHITITPKINTQSNDADGDPLFANHSAHNVGDISNDDPIGLSNRMRTR